MEPAAAFSADETMTFGPFSLMPGKRLLTRDQVSVELGDHALDILIALVRNANQTVSKRELMARVWPDTAVNDGSLRFHVAGLRKALSAGDEAARYIVTHTGRGYCFVAPVSHNGAPVVLTPVEAPRTVQPAPPTVAGPIVLADVPPRLLRMVGRTEDLAYANERLRTDRCVTITGPGGVGKTTLAIAAAHDLRDEFEGKAWFIDLGALRDPTLVSSTVASALGIPVQIQDPTPNILAFLRAKRLLLVIDNCEHVIEAAAVLIEAILQTCAEVHVLATSREALRAEGEYVFRLAPLACPPDDPGLTAEDILAFPAAEVLVERAAAGGNPIPGTIENARHIAEICRRLDGIVLAIELAASRAGSHGLSQTIALLDQSLSLAMAGRRTALPRHQTLQATLDWSYALLPTIEQRVLNRLAVFTGHFSIDAACAVAADETVDPVRVFGVVERLAAKSLISTDGVANGTGYRLLEFTRTYALERLNAEREGATRAPGRRHADYYRGRLDAAAAPGQPDLGGAIGRIASSDTLANVRTALEFSFGPEGDEAVAARLAAGASRLFLHLSLLAECRTWCERGLRALNAETHGCLVEMELQAALGLTLMFTRGNSDAVRRALSRALEIAEAMDDRLNQIRLMARLQIFHERIGDFEGALDWSRRAKQISAEQTGQTVAGVADSCVGVSLHLMGEHAAARQALDASMADCLPSNRDRTVYFGFDHRNRTGIALARTLWLQGYPDRAAAVADATVHEAQLLDHPLTLAIALIWAVTVHLWNGDTPAAQKTINRFIDLAEVNSLGPYLAVGLGLRGEMAIHQGNPAWGVSALQEALARLHAARYELLTTPFNTALAEGLAAVGRTTDALELIASTIRLIEGNGELFTMPELLRIRGRILAATPNAQGAEEAYRQALEWSRRQGALGYELRASADLARHLAREGRREPARELLEQVLSRFTEGGSTRDLRQATALLRRLEEPVHGLVLGSLEGA